MPRLRNAKPTPRGGRSSTVDEAEAGPEVGRHGCGREDGRPIALEGERGQQTHTVELGPGPQLHAGGLQGGIDLGSELRPRSGQEQLVARHVG